MRSGSTSIPRNAAPFIVAASGCAPPKNRPPFLGPPQRRPPPHPPTPPVSSHLPPQPPAKMFLRRRHKRFVRPLQNPLRPDVNPASRGHLPIHHQSRAVQLMKAVPIVPVPHQIRIAKQHPRRIFMLSKNSHRLPRLPPHRLSALHATHQ